MKLNSKGKSNANSLIDDGNVDKTSSWSFSVEDGNKILGDPPDWNEYGKWFLGIDDSADVETKEHFKYPFGKNGKVYRSGLIAIRQRAGQQNETEIFDAAGVLIDKIDGETSNMNRKNCNINLLNKIKNQSLFNSRTKGTYKIENKAEESTVYLYDEISFWGISADQFVCDFDNIKAETIHLRINSPGGDVFDGIAMYNAVRRHRANVIVHIDGIAASIAALIAMAGREIGMSENATLMIHRPWSIAIGTEDDMRAEADILHQEGDMIALAFMAKTGKTEKEILDLMFATTLYIGGQKALDAGFIDFIENSNGDRKMPLNSYDLSVFANVPEVLKERKPVPTARDTERILRDAGFSAKQAKSILAEGFKDDQRDVDPIDTVPAQEVQRDVDPIVVKKDRIADLLTRAEMAAPSTM